MWGDKDFANVFRTMSKQGKVVDVLVAATGGRRASFFRQNAAEQLILELGEELHTQYLLSFKPLPSPPTNSFRPIQVTVAGRDDLTVRTRAGYWLAASQ